MNDNKETLAGTVGRHVNDAHDHPGRETPTGAEIDQTATRSPGRTGEQGALAGGPAPGHGRATEDGATQRVADSASPTAESKRDIKDDASRG